MKELKSIAIIPARGGSKRIPRKNIKDFLGKPIIVYSIEAALKSELFDEVMVSTDDAEIAEIAEKYLRKGQKVYVEGKLKKRSWQDKEGNTRYATEIVADELTMLSRADQNTPTSNAPYSSAGTPEKPSKVDDIINKDSDDLPF